MPRAAQFDATLDALERVAAATSPEEALTVLLARAETAIGADAVHVLRREALEVGTDGRPWPLGAWAAGRAILERGMVVARDLDPAAAAWEFAPVGMRSLAAAPLGDIEPSAALCAYWRRAEGPDATNLRTLATLARAATAAIRRAADDRAAQATQAALRAASERLRLAQEAGGIGIWDIDLASDATWWSSNVAGLLGAPADAPRTREACLEAVHPEDRGHVQAMLAAAERGERALSAEFRVGWRGDGPVCWMMCRGEVERDASGAAVRLFGVIFDISDRKRAELALRERAGELETVLDATPAAIWLARDERASVIEGNRFSQELLRLERGANQSKTAPDADTAVAHFRALDGDGKEFSPEQLPVQRAARGDVVSAAEMQIVFTDGTHVDLIGNAAPLFDDAGRPRGAVAAFVDVTGRKQAERELRQREEMFRTLAEAISDVFYVTQLHPRALLYLSPAFERIWGRPRSWLLEDLSRFAETVHPEDVPRLARLQPLQERGQPTQVEYRIVLPDGSIRWIEDRSFPAENVSGRSVGLATDITPRKRLEERRELLRLELNHRVKNSLAMAQAIVGQSLRGGTSAAALDGFTKRLQALGAAHTLLTEDDWRSADLAHLVGAALGPHATRAHQCLIEGPPVLIDSRRAVTMTLALHELATNAIKHGALSVESGLVRVTWRIDESPRGTELWFEWREQGGPQVVPPSRRGFGTRLLEDILARDLGGAVDLSYAPEGARCLITAPAPLPPAR